MINSAGKRVQRKIRICNRLRYAGRTGDQRRFLEIVVVLYQCNLLAGTQLLSEILVLPRIFTYTRDTFCDLQSIENQIHTDAFKDTAKEKRDKNGDEWKKVRSN